MAGTRLAVYHATYKMWLTFDDAIPHLFIQFANYQVEIEFATPDAVACFHHSVRECCVDALEHVNLTRMTNTIEEKRGGESE